MIYQILGFSMLGILGIAVLVDWFLQHSKRSARPNDTVPERDKKDN